GKAGARGAGSDRVPETFCGIEVTSIEMRCDSCGKSDAVVKLTHVENNEMRVLNLCEACAAERGVEPESQKVNAPLADFLAQIGKGVTEAPSKGRCPACGLTAAQL